MHGSPGFVLLPKPASSGRNKSDEGKIKSVARIPIAYLIMGFVGSGKSTYAKKLELETNAFRITKDEWLIRIVGNDPTVSGFEDLDARVTDLSMDIALQLLKSGMDIIIDDGFWIRRQRDEIRERIRNMGAKYELHYVKCSKSLMKKRIHQRNKTLGKDTFFVSEEVFDKYWKYFDDIEEDEEYILIHNEESGDPS